MASATVKKSQVVVNLTLDGNEAEAIRHFLDVYYHEAGYKLDEIDQAVEDKRLCSTSLKASGARVLKALSAAGIVGLHR